MPKSVKWLILSIVIVLLDQLSKYWAVTNLSSLANQSKVIFASWLSATLAHNPGAAFSFLGDAGGWQIYFFAMVSFFVIVLFIIWLIRLPLGYKLRSMALALVIGGAVGNLIDRLRLHYVIDFIDTHWGNWHFATFNLADAAISVGAVLLMLSLMSD
jgi:signal peptidase II